MADTISTEEFMGSGGAPDTSQPTIVSTEDFMGGGGFSQEPGAAPAMLPTKVAAPTASPAPAQGPTGAQKVMQAFYAPLATAVNTAEGLVSWPAAFAGGVWAYADQLAKSGGDVGSARAFRDTVRDAIQQAIPRMQNTIQGEGVEKTLNSIPGVLMNLSTAIAKKVLPETWFEEGAAKKGRKVGNAEKFINDTADELGNFLSAYMVFHGSGAASRGVGEMKGTGPSMEPGSPAWYANKESSDYWKGIDNINKSLSKKYGSAKELETSLDDFIKAKERHQANIGMPLISTREFMGGEKGVPPFLGEKLGLGDTGGDYAQRGPGGTPEGQRGVQETTGKGVRDEAGPPSGPGVGVSTPQVPEAATAPPGRPETFDMTQGAKPTGFTPVETSTPAPPPPPSGEGTGAREVTELPPAAPPEGGGIPPTAPPPSQPTGVKFNPETGKWEGYTPEPVPPPSPEIKAWQAEEPVTAAEADRSRQATMDALLDKHVAESGGKVGQRVPEEGVPPEPEVPERPRKNDLMDIVQSEEYLNKYPEMRGKTIGGVRLGGWEEGGEPPLTKEEVATGKATLREQMKRQKAWREGRTPQSDQMEKELAQLEKGFAPKKARVKKEKVAAPPQETPVTAPKEVPVPEAKTGPKPTIAIQLDDGTKLMKHGAESPEEVAIANGVGPSRIRQVGEVTPEGGFKFDTKPYVGKMAPELLDELLDVTKEKKKASKGRTKGLLADRP